MYYSILTSKPFHSAADAVTSLQFDVNKALANGASLAGGVSVTFEPAKGYQAFQAVLHPIEQ